MKTELWDSCFVFLLMAYIYVYDSLNQFCLKKMDFKFLSKLYDINMKTTIHKVQNQKSMLTIVDSLLWPLWRLCFGKNTEEISYDESKVWQHSCKTLNKKCFINTQKTQKCKLQ